ncbi:MAG: DNA polymerase II [Candidatus Omnitrophica bacterium CG11_big_fil_rev_8_21_14_0_20_45_26]|uniref:DNA polymerase II n=1 Tax=Candidatus Abzuiibacterium crystallinum TaxID=1974748 RepID=A0A2H0LP63_9BACT|nr:MAG: DNA polymerase II [Candidatus Omnitrophica bacterium CG11_big_fil_rev_8_21_14_0_20_45_26]PIW64103.1 MAG: DNA polymerase II [Candidatus Omnitrophica bacterium CG12_big_fil_rev_8_21_14_0_65_45_16]
MDVQGIDESKKKSLEVAEEARETTWTHPSFLAQLFAGKCDWDLIFPYPEQTPEDARKGDRFLVELESFLKNNLDPDEVDRTGAVPPRVIEGLAKLGCFGMKIPHKYGGLGLSQVNYNRAMALISSYCGSTTVWLSAHQSIGVPQPLLLVGTEPQREKYLPLFAKGAVSAFALTEPDVGSDPATMKTTAVPTDNGDAYILNGEKLWCTNGTVADVLIVMAKTPVIDKGKEKQKVTAFIVEKTMLGFEVIHRCQFMGLKGIENGLIRFNNMKVPKENVLWEVGKGLKLALMTLNTGRLTIPAAACGAAKWCLNVSRRWANKREQWGSVVGKHEAIAYKLASMAATTFAMESVTWLTSALADQKKTDIRLEAAMAKLFCSEGSWRITDDTVQIRGGRGYETADSLKARGEAGVPVERAMRDMRINLIIEGTSEIMRLFIAREAMDTHLKFIFPLVSSKASLGKKVNTFFKAMQFYLFWYPRQWFVWQKAPGKLHVPKELKCHVDYVEKTARKLARNLFHVMMRYQAGLEKRQRILFRLVNIGSDLFGIAASCSRAAMLMGKDPNNRGPIELANLISREAERRINRQFHGLFLNDDKLGYRIANDILENRYSWLEQGIIPFSPDKNGPDI